MRSSLLLASIFVPLLLAGCGSSSSSGASSTAASPGGAAGAGGNDVGNGGASSGAAGAAEGGSANGGDAGAATAGASGASAAGTGGAAGQSAAGGGTGVAMTLTIGGDRPTKLYIPASYDPSTPMPLLVMLHGYSASGAAEELYLNLLAQSGAQGFLYTHPDGTIDSKGNRFWNATDACCNFDGSTVDDEGYLMGLVDEISQKTSVDQKRIYFFGHSNGGFMTYRMACHHADRIAGAAVLAGEMYSDLTQCMPDDVVPLLHVQGTADTTIPYDGGTTGPGAPIFPSATTSVADWVTFDGCSAAADTSSPPLDLESSLAGAETTVTKYGGCQKNTAVELWTIVGGGHIPAFTASFAPDMTEWLMAKTKL